MSYKQIKKEKKKFSLKIVYDFMQVFIRGWLLPHAAMGSPGATVWTCLYETEQFKPMTVSDRL